MKVIFFSLLLFLSTIGRTHADCLKELYIDLTSTQKLLQKHVCVKSIKIKDAPFCKKNEPEGLTKNYKKEIKKIEQKILNCLG